MTFENGDWVKRRADAQGVEWIWGDKPFRVMSVDGKRIHLDSVALVRDNGRGWFASRFEPTTKPNPLARFL